MLHGFEKLAISEILTGDTVMLHPEDQFEYRAERTRDGKVVLWPKDQQRCSMLTYSVNGIHHCAMRLWVKGVE